MSDRIRIEHVPLDEVTTWPHNPKLHDKEGITASIERFGFINPLTYDETTKRLVAGHGRLEQLVAMHAAGKAPPDRIAVDESGRWCVPIMRGVAFKNEAEAAAFVVADNQLTLNGGYDDQELAATLKLISDAGASYEGTGLDAGDVDSIIASALEAAQGAGDGAGGDNGGDGGGQGGSGAPGKPAARIRLPETPDTQKGDIVCMGSHILICGDCTDVSLYKEVFGAEGHAHIAVTSPPYASQRKYDETSPFKPIRPADYTSWFFHVSELIQRYLADDGSFFLNIKEHTDGGERDLYVMDLVTAMKRSFGWKFIDTFAWTHGGFPGHWPWRFKNQWEPVYQFAQQATGFKIRHDNVLIPTDAAFERTGDRDLASTGNPASFDVNTVNVHEGMALPGNVLHMGKSRESIEHPAMYPVDLPEHFIRAYSDPGDIVLDPFGGAGTTLIAAERTGRKAVLFEVSPGYCDMIIERWHRHTGETK